MPISAKQLNFSDISTDFDKFYNQNQDDLLSLLSKFHNLESLNLLVSKPSKKGFTP